MSVASMICAHIRIHSHTSTRMAYTKGMNNKRIGRRCTCDTVSTKGTLNKVNSVKTPLVAVITTTTATTATTTTTTSTQRHTFTALGRSVFAYFIAYKMPFLWTQFNEMCILSEHHRLLWNFTLKTTFQSICKWMKDSTRTQPHNVCERERVTHEIFISCVNLTHDLYFMAENYPNKNYAH